MPTPPVTAASAGTWTLGDLTVNRIGFGTKRLAGNEPVSLDSPGVADRVTALLRRAVELGVDHIDTAAFYPSHAHADRPVHEHTSLGWANEAIRRALWPYPEGLVIATKVGPTPGGLARPEQLRGLVEQNLRQLGRDHLDLVYLRQHGLESVAEHVGALAGLRDAGLVRHLGVSNIRPRHLAQAQEVAPIVAVQNRYGVDFGGFGETLLRTCAEQRVAFVPYFAVTGHGREVGGVGRHDAVEAVARAHGVTPAQVKLAWTLGRGPHVLAIPGTGDPDHLAQNVAAGALRLTPEDLVALG
jgi:aryl-alcohol dehydrogenase-like predicted oxidoreductase